MVQGRIGTGGAVPLMVRVPEDLRDRIKASADANGRSQNSEIVATLEEKYPAPRSPVTAALLQVLEQLRQKPITSDVRDAISELRAEILNAETDLATQIATDFVQDLVDKYMAGVLHRKFGDIVVAEAAAEDDSSR